MNKAQLIKTASNNNLNANSVLCSDSSYNCGTENSTGGTSLEICLDSCTSSWVGASNSQYMGNFYRGVITHHWTSISLRLHANLDLLVLIDPWIYLQRAQTLRLLEWWKHPLFGCQGNDRKTISHTFSDPQRKLQIQTLPKKIVKKIHTFDFSDCLEYPFTCFLQVLNKVILFLSQCIFPTFSQQPNTSLCNKKQNSNPDSSQTSSNKNHKIRLRLVAHKLELKRINLSLFSI